MSEFSYPMHLGQGDSSFDPRNRTRALSSRPDTRLGLDPDRTHRRPRRGRGRASGRILDVGRLPGERLDAAVVFRERLHPRDLKGQFRETPDLPSMASITNGARVGDLKEGSIIKTKAGKRFRVGGQQKWVTVHPVDKDGKVSGKHTVLPPDTSVTVEKTGLDRSKDGKRFEVGERVRHVDDPEIAEGEVVDMDKDASGMTRYKVFWYDSKSEVWAEWPFLMSEDEYKKDLKKSQVKVTKTRPPLRKPGSQVGWEKNIKDVEYGAIVSTAKGATFRVGVTKNYVTVYPCNKAGEVVGRHTVLAPHVKVTIEKDGEPGWLPPQVPVTSIKDKKLKARAPPSDITIHTSPGGDKSYRFHFPDKTTDTHVIKSDRYGAGNSFMRSAIAYQRKDGTYGVYWTQMIPGSPGHKDKIKELEKEHGADAVMAHDMPHATSSRIHRVQEEWPAGSIKALMGDTLLVDEPDSVGVERFLGDLELVPKRIAKRLKDRGVKVHIGNRRVPDLDDMAHLRNIQPRGYRPGLTWQDSGGCYSPSQRFATAGDPYVSGSASTVLHELGHAVGHVMHVDNERELLKHQQRLYPKLASYYQQGGPGGHAGAQELWAESFAEYLLHGEKEIARKYDQPYADWMTATIKNLNREPALREKQLDSMKTWDFKFEDPQAWRDAVDASPNHDPKSSEQWKQALIAEYFFNATSKGSGKSDLTQDELALIDRLTGNVWNMYGGTGHAAS